MNEPHVIRLRGPWQRQIVDGPELPPKTVTMPGGWLDDLGVNFAGTVEYQRFFNRPTGIDETTTLRLAFTKILGQATISLNSKQLTATETPGDIDNAHSLSCDVTGLLESRNDLRVRIVSAREADGGLVGEVQLKIG